MHDFFIAFAFIAFVVGPCLVTPFTDKQKGTPNQPR
jgi:hypothetical protein